MLKRISHIKGVSSFQECNANQILFDKITLIYGRNTYGKSTLGDIFSSLQKNNPELINSRKSIPANGQQPNIKMKFAADGENENDGTVQFSAGQWQNTLRESHRLRVCDDAFFHDNVFSARKFTRETKVGLSQFILGEQGVTLVNQISELKTEKREKNRRKSELLRDVFNNVGNVEEFLAIEPIGNHTSLNNELEVLKENKRVLVEQKRSAESIKRRDELGAFAVSINTIDNIELANEIFVTSLNTHHEDAKAALEEHIRTNMAVPNNGENWIHQGLKYNNDESCQFCGQDLSQDAKDLLDIYKHYFDDAYERHNSYVKQRLESLSFDSEILIKSQVEHSLLQKITIIEQYPELQADQDMINAKQRVNSFADELKRLVDLIVLALGTIKTEFDEKSLLKRAAPHVALAPIDQESIVAMVSEFNSFTQQYNDELEMTNQLLLQFKSSLDESVITSRLEALSSEIQIKETMIQRIQKQDACTELEALIARIAELEVDIPIQETALNTNQNAYLDQFFISINAYFSALGSRDFRLERMSSNQGNTPIYYLKVKFKGFDVNESDLDKIFSESDRRALGLAVFLSSLDVIEAEELEKTVVVFDDPVTSFDDHRVGQTHRKLVDLSQRCEQVILLSHYKEGLSQFLKTYSFGNTHNIKLVEISKNNSTSNLKAAEIVNFIRSAHDENRENILDFIESRTDSLLCQPRVYLETELALRFGKQIREHNISDENLNSRIESLKDNSIISEDIAIKLHRWREDLNPEHHIWLGNDIDDKRNTTAEFMSFLYHELVPMG